MLIPSSFDFVKMWIGLIGVEREVGEEGLMLRWLLQMGLDGRVHLVCHRFSCLITGALGTLSSLLCRLKILKHNSLRFPWQQRQRVFMGRGGWHLVFVTRFKRQSSLLQGSRKMQCRAKGAPGPSQLWGSWSRITEMWQEGMWFGERGGGLGLDLGILEVFSNHKDSNHKVGMVGMG